MSDELYATLGRKQQELESLNGEYDRLLNLLSQVVTGTVDRERVSVDLVARSWKVEPEPVATPE